MVSVVDVGTDVELGEDAGGAGVEVGVEVSVVELGPVDVSLVEEVLLGVCRFARSIFAASRSMVAREGFS